MRHRESTLWKVLKTTQFFLFLVAASFAIVGCQKNLSPNSTEIRFGICADVHKDVIHDADRRLKIFVDEMNRREVDFIVQNEGRIIPIEVKAEVNLKARSFKFFCEKYQPQTALRFSMKDYKEESWMVNLPLYTAEYAL